MVKLGMFSNIKSFAAWIGCILFAEILGSVCFRSSLSTIERRFTLSSTTTALLASCFQIGSMPVIIFVSYYGSRYHRPRSVAIGCYLMSLGFFLVSLPQLIGDRYEFVDISSNDSSPINGNRTATTCQPSATNHTTCEGKEAGEADSLYLFILFGMVVCGVGSTPIQPLGISYIDDYASKHNAALLIGIVLSIGLAAPAVGYILGAFTLKLWVDVGWVDASEIKITPAHPAWVGAWWIGLLVGCLLILIAGFPMWFYPKQLKKEEEKEDDGKKLKSFVKDRVAPSLKVESGNLISAFKRLLSNSSYLLVISISTFEAFRIAGISVFSIKYFEVIFGKSASTGSFLIGVVYLPALVIGTILGSFIVKHWKLSVRGISRLALCSLSGTLLFSIPIMFIGCETIATAGVTVPYPNSELLSSSYSPTNECNLNCNCNENIYTPVCGPDEITYISPCHAGCLDFEVDGSGNIKNYTQCSCLGKDHVNGSVRVNRCLNSYCEELVYTILAFKTVGALFSGLHVTPLLMLMLRSLKPQDKSFGIGMAYFTFRLLAFIPGPVIFGSLIDKSCMHWTNKPCSTQSYCSVFESVQFRYTFGGLTAITQVCSLSAASIFYIKYGRHDGGESDGSLSENSNSKANTDEEDRDSKPILTEDLDLTETVI